MAVPNVNQITSTLRMMGDRQLQQYAAMHKNDPYILPMAIAESNARKQMRAQSQAQAMGQPQPKVADADIAAMAPQAPQAPQPPQLPEQQGIGALPAQNIQHMADGGIAGYAGGGSDESLAYDNEPVMRMAGGGIAHFAGPADQLVGGVAGDIPGYVPSATNFMPQAGAAEDLPLLQRKTREAAEAVRDGTATPQQKALVGWANRLGFGTPDLGKQETGSVFTPGSTSGFATSSPITATGAAPEVTGTKTGPTPPPMPNVNAGAAAPELAGLSNLAKMRQNIYNQQDFQDPAAKQVSELGAEMTAGAERRKKEFEDYEKAQGDVFKGREARLAEREADIGKQKESNTGLAFLNAGLAIMSTPGGLATAIGKGAQVGTAQYAAGLDKIRAAQERLGDARDKMEELRLNREDMSFKQRSALSAEIDKAKLDAKRMGIDGIRMAADVNEKRASDIFGKTVDLAKTSMEQAGANARAARNPQLELIQALQTNPGLAATYQAMHGAKNDLMAQYTDYLGKNPTGSVEDFLKTKAVFSSLGNITSAKPVSSLPPGASVAPR